MRNGMFTRQSRTLMVTAAAVAVFTTGACGPKTAPATPAPPPCGADGERAAGADAAARGAARSDHAAAGRRRARGDAACRRTGRRRRAWRRRRWPRTRHAAAAARAAAGCDAGAGRANRVGDEPTPDPRVGLKAGAWDAGQAAWNMKLILDDAARAESARHDALGPRVHAASTRFRATTTASRSTTSRTC